MYTSSQFIFDFAVVISPGPGKHLERIDITIVPRVSRLRPTATFCKPGSQYVSPGLRGGIPFAVQRPNAVEGLPGPEYFMCENMRHERRLRAMLNATESVCSRSTGYNIRRDVGLSEDRGEDIRCVRRQRRRRRGLVGCSGSRVAAVATADDCASTQFVPPC